MKVNFFQILGIIGFALDSFNKAIQDGSFDVADAFGITVDLASKLNLPIDSPGFSLAKQILTDILNAAADKVITLEEIISIVLTSCKALGVTFDSQGIDLSKLSVEVPK